MTLGERLAEHYDAQEREFERTRAIWERFAIEVGRQILEMVVVEYEYVLEPPPRPRRETLLMGTVGG